MRKGMLYLAVCAASIIVVSHASPVGIVPGRILLKMRGANCTKDAEEACNPFSGKKVDEITALGVHVMNVPEQGWQQALDDLKRNPNTEFAEPDYIIEMDAIPNDPYVGSQWHLSKIRAPAAWDKTTGSSSIIVAILDTGVESTHPDLASKLVAGWNFYDN